MSAAGWVAWSVGLALWLVAAVNLCRVVSAYRRRRTPSTSSHPAPGEDDPTAARPHTVEDR